MFTPEQERRTVPASGELSAKIAIVGEAPSHAEIQKKKPFVGPAGNILESCLHGAGVTRSECYITNLADYQIKGEKLYNSRTDRLTPEGQNCAERLRSELWEGAFNVVAPCGGPAACALIGTGKISKVRGYLFDSTLLEGRKCIPTIHPAATMRGQFIQRHYIVHDFLKIKEESEFPEIKEPDDVIWVPSNIDEVNQAFDKIDQHEWLSVDIETKNHECSCIGFGLLSPEGGPLLAIVIPLHSDKGPPWALDEEVYIWQRIAKVMEDDKKWKLFQNGIFDMFFLMQRNGVYTEGRIDDTMIAHHIMYPDFQKSLEFLGSIYTHRRHWKSMVNFRKADRIKQND